MASLSLLSASLVTMMVPGRCGAAARDVGLHRECCIVRSAPMGAQWAVYRKRRGGKNGSMTPRMKFQVLQHGYELRAQWMVTDRTRCKITMRTY
eukprot:scaffold167444_cov31-Tisochrysis_lutea.AAC.1